MKLVFAVTGRFPSARCPGFDSKAFWRHASASAVCARALARRMRFNPDVAFTAGMLHDLGQLVLVCTHPEAYGAVLVWRKQQGCSLIDVERAVLGADHVDAGVALANHWHFSDAMRRTRRVGVSWPRSCTCTWPTPSSMRSTSPASRTKWYRQSLCGWEAMGLNEEAYGYLFQETERQCEEMSAIMSA